MKKAISIALAAGVSVAFAQGDVVEQAAAEKGAVKTPSGMVYRALTEGSGASPKETDVVRVHYKGTLSDGKELTARTNAASRPSFR
jgi:FKBP-type peptidyl-prolyl cis-trans isomerase FkpA